MTTIEVPTDSVLQGRLFEDAPRSEVPVAKRVLFGAMAGLLATVPMTLFMTVMHRRLPLQQRHPLPPEHVVAGLAAKLHMRESPAAYKAQLGLAHYGFGAGTGAVYFILRGLLRRAPPFRGPLYGLLVWAVSYLGILPGAKILPPATEDSSQRNALMIAAHLVWGFALQLCEHRLLGQTVALKPNPRVTSSR